MNLKLMRLVDYWFGVPLCFLVSIWSAIVSKLCTQTKVKPQNILFIELSEMGSAIIAYSALVKARELFPGSKLYFLIFRRNKESVEILKLIDNQNILLIDDRSFWRFIYSSIYVVYKMRSAGIDTTIDLELYSRATALLTYLSGASNRVGFHDYMGEGLYRGNIFNRRVIYNNHQHTAFNFLSLVFSLLEDETEEVLLKRNVQGELVPLPSFVGDTVIIKKLKERLTRRNPNFKESANLIIINPDPGLLFLRGWAVENYVELCVKLAQHSANNFIVVVGTKKSSSYAQTIAPHIEQTQFIDFTGETDDINELLNLLSISRLLITSDSGPAHMAALTPIHSIVFYGPETPVLYAPLSERATTMFAGLSCSPCFSAANHRKSACTNNKCLQAIKVGQVYQNALKLLGAI